MQHSQNFRMIAFSVIICYNENKGGDDLKRLSVMMLTVMLAGMTAGIPVFAAEPGDLNGDGSLTTADAVLMQEHLLTVRPLDASQGTAADLNLDGKINAADFSLLKGLLLGNQEHAPVWQDEFDGDALNPANWAYELGNWKLDENGNYITGGWGNNEQEFYTNQNASVHGGILTIAARQEAYHDEIQGDYAYTSARISSQHLFSCCGGRIEVRARCDAGKSLWPAIWMLPEDSAYGGWAASGEIDIMEGWGSTPEKICGTIHFGDVWPNNTYLTANYNFPAEDSSENWHTYAVEWEKTEIRWFVDDVCYSRQSDWFSEGHAYPAPFDQNFYLILNLAVGGHFDGIDGIYADPNTFADGEKHFDIDYVRVYDSGGFAPTVITSLPLGSYIEGADASVANRDGYTVISVKNPGSLEYGVMGLLRGQTVLPETAYLLEFDVQSTAARDMIVTAEDAAYTRYLDETVKIGTEPVHCSYSVTFPSEMKADIKFQLGNIGNAAEMGAHTVTLSNIRFVPKSDK